MTIELNIFNISHQPVDNDNNDVCEVNILESAIHDSFLNSFGDDSLEKCLSHFNMNIDEDHLISEVNSLLETTPLMDINKWEIKDESFLPSKSIISPFESVTLSQLESVTSPTSKLVTSAQLESVIPPP